MKKKTWLGIGVMMLLLGTAVTSLAGGPKRIGVNRGAYSVTFDAGSGRLVAMGNPRTNTVHELNSDDFVIVTDQGTLRRSNIAMKLVSEADGRYRYAGRLGNLEVRLDYVFAPDHRWFDRHLSITNISSSDSLVVKNVTDGMLRFAEPFDEMAFHDDNMDKMDPGTEALYETDEPSIYRCSLNVWLRGDKGGLFAGLKYPYWKANFLENRGLDMTYVVNMRLAPGDTLELPTFFMGTYEKVGYTCRKELHWTPRILRIEQEEMDWGEVWAMQEVLRDYLPEEKLPEPGYYLWLNSWWAKPDLHGRIGEKEAEAYCSLLQQAKWSGCVDSTVLAPVWAGWAGFLQPAPEIDAVGDDAVFPLNPHIEKVLNCAKTLGTGVFGFCEPSALKRNYRADKPEWRLQPTPDPEKRLIQKCQANDAYMDWFYRLTCSAIDRCNLSGWAWDHCWVRRPIECYSTEHGHEPGNTEFHQYHTVTRYIQRLRDRYPNYLLEIYWGLKEAGTWSHKGLNSLENLYENNSPPPPEMTAADDQRFQHWYNHNYRFFPTYMNLAQINFGKEKNGHVYSILSSLSSSTHGSLTDWVWYEDEAKADEIFGPLRRWKAWATEHMAYLRDRVDLFGQPCRKNGIDGTAHILGDRGFIFAFNPWPATHAGSVPLTKLIGLTKGTRFSFDEISGDAPKRLAVCKRGESFEFVIPGKSAMLIELTPTDDPVEPGTIPADVTPQSAFQP